MRRRQLKMFARQIQSRHLETRWKMRQRKVRFNIFNVWQNWRDETSSKTSPNRRHTFEPTNHRWLGKMYIRHCHNLLEGEIARSDGTNPVNVKIGSLDWKRKLKHYFQACLAAVRVTFCLSYLFSIDQTKHTKTIYGQWWIKLFANLTNRCWQIGEHEIT